MRFKLNAITAALGASILALSGCSTNAPRVTELANDGYME